MFSYKPSKFSSISSFGLKSENHRMIQLNPRKFMIALALYVTTSTIIADQQILILVEPESLESNKTKSKTSKWQFTSDNQKRSLQKVLRRSANNRQKILEHIFSQNQENFAQKLATKDSFSKDKIIDSVPYENHYFQLHNQDWRESVNKQFNSTANGIIKVTPAQFLDLPEYHFDKSAKHKQIRKSYIRPDHNKKGAYRFQPTISRLFQKPTQLPKKQNYRIVRRNSNISEVKKLPVKRSKRGRNARIQTGKIYPQRKNETKMGFELNPPKGEQSRWSVSVGARTSRDKGELKAYRNESSFNLSRNTSAGDQWFIEWTRANDTLGNQAKFETLGLGFKKFYEGYNDERKMNPYVAMMVKNWRGKLKDIKGVPLMENVHNKLIPVARLGIEYQLNDLTNLDLHIDGNGNYMKFTDANGQKYNIKSHHSSVGMGVNYEF